MSMIMLNMEIFLFLIKVNVFIPLQLNRATLFNFSIKHDAVWDAQVVPLEGEHPGASEISNRLWYTD